MGDCSNSGSEINLETSYGNNMNPNKIIRVYIVPFNSFPFLPHSLIEIDLIISNDYH